MSNKCAQHGGFPLFAKSNGSIFHKWHRKGSSRRHPSDRPPHPKNLPKSRPLQGPCCSTSAPQPAAARTTVCGSSTPGSTIRQQASAATSARRTILKIANMVAQAAAVTCPQNVYGQWSWAL